MRIKKFIAAALLPMAFASLFACDRSDGLVKKSDICLETAAIKYPFKKGYYVGDGYTLNLVYVGNETECSYGVSVLDSESGDEAFFGLVYNVSEKANSLTVPGYNNRSAMLFVDKIEDDGDDCVVRITDMSEEGISAALCGDYKYEGVSWSPISDEDSDAIKPGTYVNGRYTLTVSDNNGEFSFYIADNDGTEMFHSVSRMGGDLRTVMLGEDNALHRFAKVHNADGIYIEVSIIGYYTECDYLGNFKLVE